MHIYGVCYKALNTTKCIYIHILSGRMRRRISIVLNITFVSHPESLVAIRIVNGVADVMHAYYPCFTRGIISQMNFFCEVLLQWIFFTFFPLPVISNKDMSIYQKNKYGYSFIDKSLYAVPWKLILKLSCILRMGSFYEDYAIFL